jgi:fatty acyl-CoA reductase
MLEETVSIVFHAAATVRFDDPLKSAVLLNTRGRREIMMTARCVPLMYVYNCSSDHPLLFNLFASCMLYL